LGGWEIAIKAGLETAEAGVTPESVSRAFAEGISALDLEAAGACLAAKACLLTPEGTEVRGRAKVRETLAQLTAIHSLIRAEAGRVLISGEMAVAAQRWKVFTRDDPAREPAQQDLSVMLVLAREEPGWQVAVVAPWGM
jgi:ketosteroid isomerase-like protein